MKIFYAILMWFIRLTWGFLDTLIGAAIFLYFYWFGKPVKIAVVANTIVMELSNPARVAGWGLSSGCFIFSNTNSIWNREYLLFHEWGHSWPQLLALGPLHPFLVSLPSVIRFQLRERKAAAGKPLPPYDSVWFEGTATRWGTKWFQWGVKHQLWS